jgi:uncharacterized membrane protein
MEILAIKSAYSTALVIAIKRISVLFAVIIGGKIFKEKELMRRTIATIILVVGALLVIRF